MSDKPVTLAAITGAHGVAGDVRLKLFGEGLASFKLHKTFNDAALTLQQVRDDKKGGAIARFAEVKDRSAAEKLRGTTLTVPRSALPELDEGEYYHADLIGLAAVSNTGEALGKVIAINDFGAGDVIEIRRAEGGKKGGKTFLVPMRIEAVPAWDAETLTVSEDFVEE
ncbi:ribosome maturation factor RimM [Aurantiacibacter aquimixticola]|uniref:Ribosome maturation factor RimM n=1 Tax=Aurantiacibacter aquimixticola TaxID=1958945 RepID=A0A419RSP9_9SPHN|nr:ribosome maturation factor RimM [Aurantiacibacter aquimixticola]RJY08808.1 16S rRNA processing protein RimM [Aurantiacibacter aquimixticola]